MIIPIAHSHYSLGLTGYPLGHSLSPGLHAAALKASGLQGEYRLYPIPPLPAGLEALERLIVSLRKGDLDGLNVTIPHKQAVIAFLDDLTPLAQKIGAVNTIYRQESRLIGDNTDAPGFIKDLSRHFTEFHTPLTALVLGSGGSARTVVDTLLGAGWHVIIAARQAEKGWEIITGSDFNDEQCEVIGLGSLPEFIRNYANFQPKASGKRTHQLHPALKLIVNTTPVGMLPNIEASPWPEDLSFPSGAFVYDLVYNPLETMLVRSARCSGLEAAGGLGMLIEQASLSFERWTGVLPSPDVLRQGILTAAGVLAKQEL
jgi:shikimate dehydrogenase